MLSLQIATTALHDLKTGRRCAFSLILIARNESLLFSTLTATMVASKPLIALALLSGANALALVADAVYSMDRGVGRSVGRFWRRVQIQRLFCERAKELLNRPGGRE